MDWQKKLANIKTSDLLDDTKDQTWVQYVLAVLIGLPLLICAGLAGGLICYISICMGASIGDIKATLYVCIFIILFLGLLFCGCGWLTKRIYKKKKQDYRREVENRRNKNMHIRAEGGMGAYGQTRPQQTPQRRV